MASLRILFLKYLLKLHNFINNRINGMVVQLNNGIHPKHRIMDYHKFFLDNIEQGSKVLDIGCGIGALTYSISKKAGKIVACDYNVNSISIAIFFFSSENIQYLIANATEFEFEDDFNYIILSNVLEHIQDRVGFLENLRPLAKFILIRVPMINRSWIILYKRELGLEDRLDKTHQIEYTLNGFKDEMKQANLELSIIVSNLEKFGQN
jgi:2-polyprenyl-3-methyl-5-hydroxy-6-metoxy-1,4-benzoquinol methylase